MKENVSCGSWPSQMHFLLVSRHAFGHGNRLDATGPEVE
jgi:hypothetical protein